MAIESYMRSLKEYYCRVVDRSSLRRRLGTIEFIENNDVYIFLKNLQVLSVDTMLFLFRHYSCKYRTRIFTVRSCRFLLRNRRFVLVTPSSKTLSKRNFPCKYVWFALPNTVSANGQSWLHPWSSYFYNWTSISNRKSEISLIVKTDWILY